ncbi:MAG TPA: hypothetical protein VIL20_18230 [Sandaracinaceae bacterium]
MPYPPDAILPTPTGWSVAWPSYVDDVGSELVVAVLSATGELLEPLARWRDREAAEALPGAWVAGHDAELAIVYERWLASCAPATWCWDRQLAFVRLDERGSQLAPARMLAAGGIAETSGLHGITWAGYSYVYVQDVIDERGEHAGIRLRRICP